MVRKLNPRIKEAARKKGSLSERREERKRIMQENIRANQTGKGVVVIPPPVKQYADEKERPKLRVAAYCRVSTQEEEQVGSFEAQVAHFKNRIESNPNWTLVEIFQDEGISGTSVRKRLGFQRMIQTAVDGKIDLILTKSISRFGRNIVDILANLRLLAALPRPVAVEFEREGITHCGDGPNNLIIAILSALAEMESQQKSEAIKDGIRWRMAQGIYLFSVQNTIGYYRDHFGQLHIEPTEAKIVKFIYDSCLEGATPSQIAASLTEQGFTSPKGLDSWPSSTVKNILRNEKYCGDALMQKTVTTDYRTHKSVKNTIVNKYFREGHHTAIIEREKWNQVQKILETHKKASRAVKLRELSDRFMVKRVKDGLFKGFFILDPRWSADERHQFLKIIDSVLNKNIMKEE